MQTLRSKEKRKHGRADFPLAFYHVPPTHPRYSMPFHWHEEAEWIYMHDGSFTIHTDQGVFHLGEGDLLLLPKTILHGGVPEKGTYSCLVFSDRLLRTLTIARKEEDYHKNFDVFSEAVYLPLFGAPLLQRELLEFFRLLLSKEKEDELLILSSFYHLTALLRKELLQRKDEPLAIASRPVQSHALRDVLTYIHSNIGEDLSLEDLANRAGFSPRYFCRYFKKIIGRTPMEYVNYYRMEMAAEMLLTEDKSLKEVASDVGYQDLSHFIRLFKKYKGTTPKRFLTNPMQSVLP